ncbi:Biopolymer transport protein exbD2 [Saliniradius amylolyticus]|uniref:Biopolymer transport protein exbD2 n=1 Tax=Saliniradius amylolyticus TaxID=2183582 RepID=A0A2S2E5G0_9ALTE|nr:biopolymer transporter ExbD [Saliniradius amylolyticus]AWL12898.1 Biopolymer transport protein exbD2 [Saliniradius amylolyticus]
MKRKHGHSSEEANVDMTPMLDIVFIMLIFFIVTTSFVKEKGLIVNRPENAQKSNKPSKNVSIRIANDGTITMNGRQIDIRRVEANIQNFLAENITDNAVVQAGQETEHGIVVEVLDQAKKAGLHKLSVVVEGDAS